MSDDGDVSVRELFEALEERERHIDELEAVILAQEEKNEKCRNELDDKASELQESQKLLNQLRLDHANLQKERTHLEEQVNTQKSQLDEQRNILAIASKSSEDAKKIQRDGNQHLYKLELENQRLRATILEIEENEDILVTEIDTLVQEKSDLQQQSEELSSKCDLLSADVDDKARVTCRLLQEKEKAENDLAAQTEEHQRAVKEWHRKDTSSSSEIARLLVELELERAKSRENTHVKENESLRNELIRVRKENQKVTSLYDQCLLDKNQAEQDLDSAIQSLNQSKRDAKDQIAAGLQRLKLIEAETRTKLDTLQAKLDGATQMSFDAQEKVDDLRKQLECSDARNALYEQKNGLSEVIRMQKQLEEDVKRRDFDLKRLNHALGIEKERCRALTKVRDWLKDKANLGPDFTFDDPEMKSALECDDYRLRSENAELSRQIESLEGERIKLLSQLRERAIDIGERGGRFLGMSSEQVSQLLEFASNLRRGVAELPLNDRSKELLSEISRLKSEREIDKATIVGLEREIVAREPRGGEGNILKQIIDSMTAENQKLRDELKAASLAAKPIEGSTVDRENTKIEVLNNANVPVPVPNGNGEIYKHGDRPSGLKLLNCSEVALLDSNVGAAGFANGSNEKALDTGSLERTIKKITHERDALYSQVRKLVAETENGSGRYDAISELVTLTVKCKTLEGELREEKGLRIIAQQHRDECRKRILILDNWKRIATNTMERQVASYNPTTNRIPVDCVHMIRELLQQKEESVNNPLNEIGDKEDSLEEITNMKRLLKQTHAKLSEYVGDVKKLQTGVLSLQENRTDSSRMATKISCLNDIIQEKSKMIQEGMKKIADLKQRNINHSHDQGYRGHRSDRSTSTNSIDEAIERAANSAGHESQTRNNSTEHELLFEKENIICEQNHKIMELKQKLLHADLTYQRLSNETQSMKADISTLVSRLGEAESAVNGINVYQRKSDEAQELLAKAKEEVESAKKKVSTLLKEREKQDAKIKYLVATETRTKTILSVTRQGKARIEVNLKAATEEVASLKESLEKMGAQMNTLKAEKIEAQNEKLKLSKKARVSATKLKDLADECNRKENSKVVEDLTKRVEVLNKTVSGLATQNSSLRCELAACKAKRKAEDEAAATHLPPSRGSVSRERPTSSLRAKLLEEQVKSLEEQVKTLGKSHAEEKSIHASDMSSMEERYQKQIHELEKAMQYAKTAPARKSSESDDSSREQVVSLTNENNALKQRIKASSDAEAQLRHLKTENDALRKENERLSQVDHLDFFEEIEDLKSKYNEAVRQINQLTTR